MKRIIDQSAPVSSEKEINVKPGDDGGIGGGMMMMMMVVGRILMMVIMMIDDGDPGK
jgi:hypothetical protein